MVLVEHPLLHSLTTCVGVGGGVQARQRLEMTHGRIDDLEIAIDMHVAEKEEYKEQFNDTSDRLAAVQVRGWPSLGMLRGCDW
jgi:hypothetical protein